MNVSLAFQCSALCAMPFKRLTFRRLRVVHSLPEAFDSVARDAFIPETYPVPERQVLTLGLFSIPVTPDAR